MYYSKWNVHVSCTSQHISCAQIQKVSCVKFPVIILNSLKFHACYMHGLVPNFHACSMYEKYAYFMHETCMFWAYSMRGTGVYQARYRHIPCVVQAYSKHNTGVFHAWYRHIPSTIQVYSMRGTGVFHSCVHHAQYSYRHINPWTEYLCYSTILAVILYTSIRHCAPAEASILFKKLIVDTGFQENRQILLAAVDMHIIL